MTENDDLMTLKTKVDDGAQGETPHASPSHAQTSQPPHEASVPLLGIFAVGFSVLSIFSFAPVFVPLGLILGIIALFIGQVMFGIVAIFLAVIGIITSPTILMLVSMVSMLSWLGL